MRFKCLFSGCCFSYDLRLEVSFFLGQGVAKFAVPEHKSLLSVLDPLSLSPETINKRLLQSQPMALIIVIVELLCDNGMLYDVRCFISDIHVYCFISGTRATLV